MAVKIPATGAGDTTPTVATDVLGDGSHAQKVKLLDGTAGSANAATVDSSGNVHTAVQSLPGSPAQEGTDGTGIAQPAGGAGLRGWLSGIYKALTGTLTVDGSGHTQPVSGTVTANAGTGTMSSNVSQVAGTATDTNSGAKSAGTQRVVLATDQPQLTAALKVDGSAVTQPVSGTVTANAGSGTLAVSQASSADVASTLTDGRKTVTTAGTALALAASTACKWVTVTALNANTQPVAVGGSDVLAAAGSEKGVVLQPGASVTVPVTNVATVFVDSRVNGEGVSFMVGA